MTKNSNRFTIERGENLGSAYQDVTKLRQASLNLLSNAAKFTRDGRIVLSVERESAGGADWLIFSVLDTGIGIAADKLDRVFEEFSQADDSTTRDYGGTGLGLAISRRFCQMLGGDLSVVSRPGVGSTFTIRLPAMLPGAGVPQEERPQPAAEDVQVSGGVGNTTPGSNILVIDDDSGAGDIIRRLLEKDGFNVVTAFSGEEGLKLAHQLQPAVITLDVMMPVMDGFDFLLAMRGNPDWRDIPVIVVTAKDLTEDDRTILSGKVEQILEKSAFSLRRQGGRATITVYDDFKRIRHHYCREPGLRKSPSGGNHRRRSARLQSSSLPFGQ